MPAYNKVKWSRYSPGVAQRVGRGIAVLFHDRGTRRVWVVRSTPRPHFTPGKVLVPILQEAGWAIKPVWTGGKSRPNRDSIPDRPARSQSLYRLSYPAHIHIYIYIYKVKVKWSRYWPDVAQRVGRGIALPFHDRGTRRVWVVRSTHRPQFTPGKVPVPILQEAGWAPRPVWTGEKSRHHRDSISDHPARSQSLYRLSYTTNPAYNKHSVNSRSKNLRHKIFLLRHILQNHLPWLYHIAKLRYLARTDSTDRLYLSSSISYLLRGFLSAEMGPSG